MSFTAILYQGRLCRDVRFERSRGYESDLSWVTFLARSVTVAPASLTSRPSATATDLSQLLFGGGAAKVPVEDVELAAEGALELVCKFNDELFRVMFPGLFVGKIETTLQSGRGDVKLVKAFLVDERHFGTLGCLPLWTFNRVTAQGDVAPDSLDGNKPWSLKRIVEQVIGPALFRSPRISHVPDDFADDFASRQFPPYSSSVAALRRVVEEQGLEEPCHRLDGTLALHAAGDGFLGSCSVDKAGKPSGENVLPFRPELLPYLGGEAQGAKFEPGFPERFVIIRGAQTIQSVAVDDWQAVIIENGRPVPVTEQTIRRLTSGAYGLEWLHRWLLAPPSFQSDGVVGENVAKLLREQCYRLFRLPGVTSAADDGKPGPNAHLLPLLPRAETADGKRRPITVETYTYTTRAIPFLDSALRGEQLAALTELAAARDALEQAAVDKGLSGGFGKGPTVKGLVHIDPDPTPAANDVHEGLFTKSEPKSSGDPLRDVQSSVASFGSNRRSLPEDFLDALREVRQLDTLQKIDPALASEYEIALRKKLAVDDAASGTAKVKLLDLAKRAHALAKTEGVNGSKIRATARRIGSEVEKAVANAKAEFAANGPKDKPVQSVTHWNLARAVDAGASVYSAELGIIRTSSLAGHLTKEDVRDAKAGGPLIPCPVRVIFGTTLRPRLDVPQKPGATVTGTAKAEGTPEQDERAAAGEQVKKLLEKNAAVGAPAPGKKEAFHAGKRHPKPCPGGANVIPRAIASDLDGYYVAAFARAQRGVAAPIALSAVPFDRVLPIERADLFELVGLDGKSNRALHDETALALAAAQFRRPESIASQRFTILGPWAVNPDGLVERVVIRNLTAKGAPCGLVTEVTTGSSAFRVSSGTRTRSRRPDADARRREGIP